MNVLWIPVRVMKMLNAPTVTVLTAVLVNKDSLETEKHVQVLLGFKSFCKSKRNLLRVIFRFREDLIGHIHLVSDTGRLLFP